MTTHSCDAEGCRVRRRCGLHINVSGYYPSKAARKGIKLPDNFMELEFCSRECFVKWMKWALDNEL